MKELDPYINQLRPLLKSFRNVPSSRLDRVLDGEVSEKLRDSVSQSRRKSCGAFFTGTRLADFALDEIKHTFRADSVLLDNSCGAGNLLIPGIVQLGQYKAFLRSPEKWASQILGVDINPRFIEIAKLRLSMAAYRMRCDANLEIRAYDEKLFGGLRVGNGLNAIDETRLATHLLINPPFVKTLAPASCSWATGKVNSAALFAEKCIVSARKGTRIMAILPDVLRSGSCYAKWRKLVAERTSIHSVRVFGRFDLDADVDVFILNATINSNHQRTDHCSDWAFPAPVSGTTVGDYFALSIGSVVEYRDPKLGKWAPYIDTRSTPAWAILRRVTARRRFQGTLIKPPFVVVRRTSSPNDKHRVVSSVILGDAPVAVENHLIVLRPKFGGAKACLRLMESMKLPVVSEYMNQRLRCRHLTISSIAEIPYSG